MFLAFSSRSLRQRPRRVILHDQQAARQLSGLSHERHLLSSENYIHKSKLDNQSTKTAPAVASLFQGARPHLGDIKSMSHTPTSSHTKHRITTSILRGRALRMLSRARSPPITIPRYLAGIVKGIISLRDHEPISLVDLTQLSLNIPEPS